MNSLSSQRCLASRKCGEKMKHLVVGKKFAKARLVTEYVFEKACLHEYQIRSNSRSLSLSLMLKCRRGFINLKDGFVYYLISA